jgi:hypothetical protein
LQVVKGREGAFLLVGDCGFSAPDYLRGNANFSKMRFELSAAH